MRGNKMKNELTHSIAMILCSILLFGCSATRGDYHSPELNIPASWSVDTVEGDLSQSHADHALIEERPDKWWTLFNDPQLNRLIDQVLASNSDLAKATLTLKKARLESGVAKNNQQPQLSFSHDSTYSYDTSDSLSDTSYEASLSLSYELDMWGRVDALANASEWTAQSSYEDRENTAQNLVVTTAMLYWKVGYLNQMMALTTENIIGTKRIAHLTKLKHATGSVSRLDVLEATQTLFDQQLQLSQLQQALSETQNALSLLLAQPLQDSGLVITQLSTRSVPDINPGVPSERLLRRPDVKASLYTLKSSFANKEAIGASYLPTFTLTSSLNSSSSNLLNLLKNPVASLGSGMVLPFLEWNKMELNKNISEVDYQMAVVDYRNTLYQAFEEVANLLAAKSHYAYQHTVYEEQYANVKERERLYASQYQSGSSDMVDWITVMKSRRTIESSMLMNRYNQLATQIALYRSLGGGDILL
jgi:NodT family efflux transporter outer membrane factor (OMF) lipoprotein